MTNVLLNSGGADSFLIELLTGGTWIDTHVFVDVGQPYVKKELRSARRTAKYFNKPLQAIKATDVGRFETPSGIMPYRNLVLLTTAALFGENLYLGVLEGEINSDKSTEFLRATETVLDISHRKQYWTEGKAHRINTPLMNGSKVDHYVQVRRNYSIEDWSALLKTVSCYGSDDGPKQCGVCPSCFKKWVALTCATGASNMHEGFAKHPAHWKPFAHWEASYQGKRFTEIREAYAISANL